MSENQTFYTSSKEETQEVAEKFATQLIPGDVLCFYGDLGAGKTTFIQGLVRGLGVTKRIVSPTFILMRSYVTDKNGIQMFYHADLYRLTKEAEVEGTGLLEALEESDAVVAIEWPDRMGSVLPASRYDITLIPEGEDKRKITIKRIG